MYFHFNNETDIKETIFPALWSYYNVKLMNAPTTWMARTWDPPMQICANIFFFQIFFFNIFIHHDTLVCFKCSKIYTAANLAFPFLTHSHTVFPSVANYRLNYLNIAINFTKTSALKTTLPVSIKPFLHKRCEC